MNQSSIENVQPEQVLSSEQKADNISVSPSIRQCSVIGSVSVVHCKKAKYDVYIGRPSKWGNPFTNKPGTIAKFILPTREEAIDAYRKWITEGEGKHLLKDLHELKGKTLGCWCKPKSCHGDVLAELVELYCPNVSRHAFVLTRSVTKKECAWLDRAFKKGEIIYEYTGYTYGCISWNGKAFTEKENETPFFELPKDAVSPYCR